MDIYLQLELVNSFLTEKKYMWANLILIDFHFRHQFFSITIIN